MEKFVFYENEPSTVTCDFVGSGPPPVIHVIRGDVDITPLFVRTESVKLIGEPGLQYAMYHIEYKSTKLKMEKEHNGKTLYCTAQKPTFTELSQTKIAAINVLCKYFHVKHNVIFIPKVLFSFTKRLLGFHRNWIQKSSVNFNV